jgi:hypothetical protein
MINMKKVLIASFMVALMLVTVIFSVSSKDTSVFDMNNHPPSTPHIDGPVRGFVGVEYSFTFNSTDPDGDNITYIVYWDDGTGDECGPYYSGIEVTINHTWNVEGAYTFTAHAKDVHGLEGPETYWCIGISRSKNVINDASAVVTVNAVTVSKETTSTVSESSTKGYYIEITRIVPYVWYWTFEYPILCFTAELTNTGDEPCTGTWGYSAKAYNIVGTLVDEYSHWNDWVLVPDDSWLNTDKGYGLWFKGSYFLSRYFRLEFYSIPSNDYEMAKYKIFGDGHVFEYEWEQVTDSLPDIFPRTFDNIFLERFPLLNLLLQRLRI